MADFNADGSIQTSEGRTLFADDPVTIGEFSEISKLLAPKQQPLWPFVSGGGGGGGGGGPATPGSPGVQGAQGSQGAQGPGAGAQGAQGSQGSQGSNGTQGPQGTTGSQGATGTGSQGVQGPQGTNGAQGTTGAQGGSGSQGAQGSQGSLANDIFAATRVVSLIAGVGTDLTLAAAVAALPAEGGDIYLKPGVYPISATQVLPVKNVRIRGAGSTLSDGITPNATVFDLGGNAIPLFTTPAPSGGDFPSYTFEDFAVIGTSVVGQSFIEIPGGAAQGFFLAQRLNIDAVENIVKNTGGIDWDVTFRDCSLRVQTATASFWKSPGITGEMTWDHVNAHIPASGSAVAISGGPVWNVLYSYLGGGGAPSTIVVNTLDFVEFFMGAEADTFDVTTQGLKIVSCVIEGTTMHSSGALNFLSNTWWTGSKNGASPQLELTGTGAEAMAAIHGVYFDATGAAASIGVNITSAMKNVVIDGCTFTSHGTAGVQAAANATLSIGNSRFISITVPVKELATSVTGTYSSNTDFTGSIILGTTSTVDGRHVSTITGNVTLTINDETILADASGGPLTVTVPLAITVPFKRYNIKKIDATANAVTIAGTAGQLIDGAATQTITVQYMSLSPESDNISAWWIV